MAYQNRDRNPNWKGGRSVASNGYVLVRVGVGHHLADVRGYAYEHRLVAERKLGRRLLTGEQVHHVDENKQNNDPANLEIAPSAAHHRLHHRGAGGEERLRMPDEPNRPILCGCGCGVEFEMFDASGRVRRYIAGHNPPASPTIDAVVSELRREALPSSLIAKRIGRPHRAVSSCLSKLKRRGLVAQEGRLWRLQA